MTFWTVRNPEKKDQWTMLQITTNLREEFKFIGKEVGPMTSLNLTILQIRPTRLVTVSPPYLPESKSWPIQPSTLMSLTFQVATAKMGRVLVT